MSRTFVFRASWARVINQFSAELRQEIYGAAMMLIIEGSQPDSLSPAAQVALAFIADDVDRKSRRRASQSAEQQASAASVGESAPSSELAGEPTPAPVAAPEVTAPTELDPTSRQAIEMAFDRVSARVRNGVRRVLPARIALINNCIINALIRHDIGVYSLDGGRDYYMPGACRNISLPPGTYLLVSSTGHAQIATLSRDPRRRA